MCVKRMMLIEIAKQIAKRKNRLREKRALTGPPAFSLRIGTEAASFTWSRSTIDPNGQ